MENECQWKQVHVTFSLRRQICSLKNEVKYLEICLGRSKTDMAYTIYYSLNENKTPENKG